MLILVLVFVYLSCISLSRKFVLCPLSIWLLLHTLSFVIIIHVALYRNDIGICAPERVCSTLNLSDQIDYVLAWMHYVCLAWHCKPFTLSGKSQLAFSLGN